MMAAGGAGKRTELLAAANKSSGSMNDNFAKMQIDSGNNEMNEEEKNIALKGDKGQGERLKDAKARMRKK